MKRKFIQTIPKKPFLKTKTYMIPQNYSNAYKEHEITNLDEQIILFHITQFGGFRLKRTSKKLQITPNFTNKWLRSKFENGYHHYKASPEFLREFGNLELMPLEKRWRNDVVNKKEMLEHGFSNDEIEKSYTFLTELNQFYSSLRLRIPIPQSAITVEDRIALSRFNSIPFLVKKPKAGGRFFHPESSYQRICSTLRETITINGEKTCEIDLAAATIQFLSLAMKTHTTDSLEETVLTYSDPYQYFLSTLNSEEFLDYHKELPTKREALKEILYTAIYSSLDKEKDNVNRKLKINGRTYFHSDLTLCFPEFFEPLHALKSQTGIPAHIVINKEESRFAQKVLEIGCLEHRIPILPIHDSFITTTPNHNSLRDFIDFASKELYGRKLYHKRKY